MFASLRDVSSFEITPLGTWQEGQEILKLADKLKRLEANEDIVSISGPEMKLTDLGMRPMEITARQPFVVPG